MKKTILMTMLVCTFLNACAYKPIVDHRGNKGKDVAYYGCLMRKKIKSRVLLENA